jgi:transcription factor E
MLAEIGGEQCIKVATELYNISDEEITDDSLAEKCDIKLNIVRKILYILYGHKLAEFRKVRDKKSGWFIYYWRESYENIKDLIISKQKQVLVKLFERLSFEESNVFYKCENADLVPHPDIEPNTDIDNQTTPTDINNQVTPTDIEQKHEESLCNAIVTFDEAMEDNFKCKNCDGNLTHYNNDKVKDFLKEIIGVLRQNIKN